jgi:cholesterol oxidase
MPVNGFGYDVIVIGSGFGGSVTALRATDKGCRVGVMESGRRWPDSAIPKSNWDITEYRWQPELEMYGIQRLTYLDDVLVLHGSGVGGGSHAYGSTLCVPPKKFFSAPEWSYITDWNDEMPAYFDQAERMMGVVRVPYMDSDKDRLMREVATDMVHGNSFNKAPVATYFRHARSRGRRPLFWRRRPSTHRLHQLRQLHDRLWAGRQEQADNCLRVSGIAKNASG